MTGELRSTCADPATLVCGCRASLVILVSMFDICAKYKEQFTGCALVRLIIGQHLTSCCTPDTELHFLHQQPL